MSTKQFRVLNSVTTGIAKLTSGMDMAIAGNFLFCVGGAGLAVFDISRPEVPQKVHSMDTGVLTHAGRCGVALNSHASVLFVCGGKGLAAYDITNPARPVNISSTDTGVCSWSSGGQIQLHGNMIFIAGGKGLGVIDVSDPGNMRKVAKITTGVAQDQGTSSLDVDMRRGLLYFLGNKGMAIFNIQDLANITRLSHCDTGVCKWHGDRGKGGGGGGGTIKLGPRQDTAFVAGGKGVASFDVSDPSHPRKLGKISTGMGTWEGGAYIAFFGQYGYVLGGHGLAVCDMTDPTNMAVVFKNNTGAGSFAGNESMLFIADSTLAYAGGGNGIAVVDIGQFMPPAPATERSGEVKEGETYSASAASAPSQEAPPSYTEVVAGEKYSAH